MIQVVNLDGDTEKYHHFFCISFLIFAILYNMNYDQILTNIFITKANQISPKLHYIFRGKNNYDKKYKNVKLYIENSSKIV